ncbi:protein of unknown function [Bradyrhizobium vignae]|uniref:Uncharacterized protein n=1 Tax=Bradyrhizobium vignae TaxID=1549949 RepID=A0A2U3PRQ5_9BRAD|nr:protein of unknown function [Bradyrhizobium vignae]
MLWNIWGRAGEALLQPLKRDGIRMNHHRALGYCLSMIFSEKHTFRDHALTPLSFPAQAGNPVRRGFSILAAPSLEYWIARLRGR